MEKILDKINSPADVKGLDISEMNTLSQEIREYIIKKVNTTGGHMAPNLGIVETTIALHYVFNSPEDKIIFDVSHQCYPHKFLTGRKEGFTDSDKYYKYSGYTNPDESEHDLFVVGHTSTSVSLAVGAAKARDLKNEKGNVIAIIGDGSLSGGEAFEGLNNAAELNSNIVIIVNDNEMSIAENHGGLYKNLRQLRETKGKAENNFFKSMGLDYLYIENGHDFNELIETFKKVKDINRPIVIHIHTVKGKGLEQAEANKEKFHWVMPGVLDNKPIQEEESYVSITKEYILKKIQKDKTVLAISATTPGAYGFTPDFREKLGQHYTDVGIAEEHAVAYASAMAKCGAKPILSILSSFSQRTYDQLSQDLCLNNSPATILLHWGGISGADMTHLGCFDIPLISNIPNIVYLAPTCKEEYIAMLDWSVEQTKYPVAIRVPFGELVSTGKEYAKDYSQLNKYLVTEQGKDVAIIALGNFYQLGETIKKRLYTETGINATLINPRYITGIDEDVLNELKSDHKLVVTLENGVLDGGYGEKISRFYGASDVKVLNFGAKKEFTDRVPVSELYERYHLTPDLIISDIKKVL